MTLHTIAMEAFANFETEPRCNDLSNAHIFVGDSHHKLTELPGHSSVCRALEALAIDVPEFDERLPGHPLQQATALAMGTCSWLEFGVGSGNVAPSKHPLRIPVRLVIVVDTNLEIAGFLRFEDTPGKIMFDRDMNYGPIQDALKATMEAILAYQKGLGLRK